MGKLPQGVEPVVLILNTVEQVELQDVENEPGTAHYPVLAGVQS